MSDIDEADVSAWPVEERAAPHSRDLASLAADVEMPQPADPRAPPQLWPLAEPPAHAPRASAWQPQTRPLAFAHPDAVPASTTRALACQQATQAARRSSVDTPKAAPRSSALRVDAGQAMGRRFRAGWGPVGQLAVPQAPRTLTPDSASPVALLQLTPGACAIGGGAAPDTLTSLAGLLRSRAVALLETHAEGSEPAGAPARRFECTPSTLPCASLRRCVDAALADVDAAGGGGELRPLRELLLHERRAWELAERLFAHLEIDGSAAEGRVLEAAMRKRGVSEWLEEQTQDEVADALSEVRQGAAGVTLCG